MKQSLKKILVLIASLTMLITTLGSFTAYADDTVNSTDFDAAAKAAIAIDAETGKILYAKNIDEVLGIASMTKMISMAVVMDQINAGNLSWDDKITVTEEMQTLSTNYNLSNVALLAGTQVSVQDLFNASVIASANACVMILAKEIAGSEAAFVDLMREKTAEWGIKDASLINSTGLTNQDISEADRYPGSGENDENQMSARDMAIVAQHIINDYPEFLETSSKANEIFGAGTENEQEMTNWNWMLNGLNFYKEGVDGLKTGTTDYAGACFTGTITKDGWRIITVVMDATEHTDENTGARYEATSDLMDYVYENWHKETILTAGNGVANYTNADIPNGKETSTPIVLNSDVTTFVTKQMNLSNYKVAVLSTESLTAPVTQGTKAMTVQITLDDDKLGYISEDSVPAHELVTQKQIDKANIFILAGRSIKNFFQNLF